MTISNTERARQQRQLLARFAQDVGDGYCLGQFRGPKTETFAEFDHTTWTELAGQAALEPRHVGGRPQYALTPGGWLRALRESGRLQDPALRARAVTLVQALKAVVKGRTSHLGLLVDERALETTTGLPSGWIYNALSSGLLNEVFPDKDMTVDAAPSHRGFRVPNTFGDRWMETP
jgi:hypothetical protein